jgi:predicted RNA-binding protein with PIN domain
MTDYGNIDPIVVATLEGAAIATSDTAEQFAAIQCAADIWISAMEMAAEMGKSEWVIQRIGDG